MGNFCQKRPEVVTPKNPLINNKNNNDSGQNTNNENEDKNNIKIENLKTKLIECKENKKLQNNYFFSKIEQTKLLNEKEINFIEHNNINDANGALSSFNSPSKKPKMPNNEFLKGQCIGQGFFSSVYFGLSCNTGEIVAIQKFFLNNLKKKKFISYENLMNKISQAVYKFSLLNHNNIIRYFHTQPSDTEENEIEILLEFCNGGSIKQLLNKFDSFDEKLIKLYTKQVLEGLVYLHEQNIIHRNLKNSNILVDGNGVVKISDLIIPNVMLADDHDTIYDYVTKNGKGIYI